MIAIMIMLFSVPVKAQTKTGYAEWDSTNKTLTFRGGDSVPENAYSLGDGEWGAPGWVGVPNLCNICTTVKFDDSFKAVRPTSCFNWFYEFSALKTIDGIENLNTEEVTNMYYMFFGCSSLTSLDLSSFNTAKVSNMGGMFFDCSKLNSLDLSSFNTDKVTNMNSMFSGCSGLTSLDVSSFNTAEVTNMPYMFN